MRNLVGIDTHLLEACKKGDRLAQKKLYDDFRIRLFGVCMTYAKSREEAEDMLQDGFFKIFRDLKNFKGEGSLAGWMRMVVVNTALMHIRKYRKMEFADIDDDYLVNTLTDGFDISEHERANAIIYLIQKLPTAHQTVFNLRVIEGYSFREIAKKLQVNESTIRSHFLRARKVLQKMLDKSLIQ